MMRTPDGHGRGRADQVPQTRSWSASEPAIAPPDTREACGRIMFAVDDIDDTVARLRRHGAELVGEMVQYENVSRLCYMRGPAGIMSALLSR